MDIASQPVAEAEVNITPLHLGIPQQVALYFMGKINVALAWSVLFAALDLRVFTAATADRMQLEGTHGMALQPHVEGVSVSRFLHA